MDQTVNLTLATDGELRTELARREIARLDAEKPKMVENPNLDRLREMAQKTMNYVNRHGRSHPDHKQFVYEEAMRALFGDDYFTWLNKRTR